MNRLDPPKSKIKFEQRSTLPFLTLSLIVTAITVYACANGDTWFTANTLQPHLFWEAVQRYDYQTVLTELAYSNFASNNLYIMILGVYFLFVFGTAVEQRLGPARFLILFFLGTTLPWIVLIWDALYNPTWPLEGDPTPKFTLYFFGPNLLICALLGAYVELVPSKKVDLSGGMPRPRGEIFRTEKQVPVAERYGLNPWTFVWVFCAYELGLHFVTRFLWHNYDTVTLFSALAAGAVGYGMAYILVHSAMQTFKDGPLKLEAIKRYNELVDLDVSPDDAIKGTARAMGLPNEQIRDWVLKNKGRLRIS
jgi:membrane associated rhomboid family serine protease